MRILSSDTRTRITVDGMVVGVLASLYSPVAPCTPMLIGMDVRRWLMFVPLLAELEGPSELAEAETVVLRLMLEISPEVVTNLVGVSPDRSGAPRLKLRVV